jgi:hypothetical protein
MRAAALRPPVRIPSGWITIALGFLAAVVAALVAVRRPDLYRPLFAVVLLANLLIVSVRWPRAAIVTTLLFLPFLALVRRLLIADSGWTSYDPMLLVGPLVAIVLIVQMVVVEERRLDRDNLAKLVYGLLALSVVQVFNPLGAGVLIGLSGLLFVSAPLLWFVVGRELADRRTISLLIYSVIPVAVITSAYGLWQTEIGMPKWDASWVDVAGYAALQVGEQIRGFGTFASHTEYAAFAGVGVVFACALALHRRTIAALALPFLGIALFFASSRGVLVLTLVAVIVLVGLRAREGGKALVIIVLGVVTLFAGSALLGPALDRAAGRSSSNLVSHQVGGIANPLDPEQSTLIGHWDLFLSGVAEGFERPLGRGPGANNNAARAGGGGGGTDVDLSDTFVNLGFVGGLLLVAILVITFRRTVSAYFARGDVLLLAILGLLVVTLGHWLNGGHYALAPLTWFFIGWATRKE